MFKSKNFCHIASNNRNQVKVGVFVYRTPDDVDTVTQSGYFNERIIDINLHDIIIHEQIDPADNTQVAVNTLCVTGRSLDNVTTKVISTGGGGGAVDSVNGKTGAVVLDAQDVSAIPQIDTLPTASATNAGEIVQYIGETIPDVDAIAVGTQTEGSGLTDITVNTETFEGVEQPTGAETVVFTCTGDVPTPLSATKTGITVTITDVDAFMEYYNSKVESLAPDLWIESFNILGAYDTGSGYDDDLIIEIQIVDNQQAVYTEQLTTVQDREDYGLTATANLAEVDPNTLLTIISIEIETGWAKNGVSVDLADYGVSYEGTAAEDDEITVVYTPAVKGITNGYFYQSSAAYSDPTATISQTTGSGLSDLSVNVNTFVAMEEPTQSETAVFTANVVTGLYPSSGSDYGMTISIVNQALFEQKCIEYLQSQEVYDIPNAYCIRALKAEITPGSEQYTTTLQVGIATDDYMYEYWIYISQEDEADYGLSSSGEHTEVNSWETIINNITEQTVTTWAKGGETVNPADYGISFSGEPNNGDALTVVYTATTIIGYEWNQKNVQPASGSAGGGIEWKTDIDLPADWKPNDWYIAPLFKIAGGLPDGDYEFYYQIKTSSNYSDNPFIPATVTFRYIINIDNTNNILYGMFAPVVNGEYIGNTNRRIPNNTINLWQLGWKDSGGNLYFYNTDTWFTTDIHGFASDAPDVPKCFRMSAIKNMATGEEYIAEGSLYNDEDLGNQMSCNLTINPLQEQQYIPNTWMHDNRRIEDLPASGTYVCGGIAYEQSLGRWIYSSELTVFLQCGDDKFNARLELMGGDYILHLYEATGIFENTQFLQIGSGLYVKLNLPAGASGIIYSQYAVKDETFTMGVNFYPQNVIYSSSTALVPLKIGVAPTVANYLGKILQYDGITDANYTNGYFYKATGNIVTVPASISCAETSGLGKTITMDVDGFINYMINNLGYDKYTLKSWLNGNIYWSYNVDEGSLGWSYGTFYGDDATGILQSSFTISPAAASGEIIDWRTYNYTDSYTEIQNAAWEKVNTQPGATTPSTMPTLAVADWSSNTQTVTVQGVTADNNVIVSPAPASTADWTSAGVICTAQGTDTLTFTCTQTPSNDITVNVAIL